MVIPIIPVFRRLRQGDHKLEGSLGYMTKVRVRRLERARSRASCFSQTLTIDGSSPKAPSPKWWKGEPHHHHSPGGSVKDIGQQGPS